MNWEKKVLSYDFQDVLFMYTWINAIYVKPQLIHHSDAEVCD